MSCYEKMEKFKRDFKNITWTKNGYEITGFELTLMPCHSTVCYLNNYEDTQSIVAEFKKLEGARYQKEIGRMAPSQKLTKFKSKELRFASNRGHIAS